MSKSSLTFAACIFLVLAGAIWILQGLDVAFAPQSFMTDNRWWVLWGAIAVVLGVLLTFRSLRE
jgi:uncharacterized membrane protein HdeD (DUF308 family)